MWNATLYDLYRPNCRFLLSFNVTDPEASIKRWRQKALELCAEVSRPHLTVALRADRMRHLESTFAVFLMKRVGSSWIVERPLRLDLDVYLEIEPRLRPHQLFWLDPILRRSQETVDLWSPEQLAHWARSMARTTSLALPQSTSRILDFFPLEEIASWIVDERFKESDLSHLMSFIWTNPSKLIPVFAKLPPLNRMQQALLKKRLEWAGIIRFLPSHRLHPRHVVAHWIKKDRADHICALSALILTIYATQPARTAVGVIELWCHIFTAKVGVDADLRGRAQDEGCDTTLSMTIFEWMLLHRGCGWIKAMREQFRACSVPDQLSAYLLNGFFKAASYPFDIEQFDPLMVHHGLRFSSNPLAQRELCEFHLHPFLLMKAGRNPQLDLAFFKMLILDSMPCSLELDLLEPAYPIVPFTFLTSLFNPYPTYRFLDHQAIKLAPMGLFGLENLAQVASFKRELLAVLSADEELLMQRWTNWIEVCLVLVARDGVKNCLSLSITNELCNIPYIIAAAEGLPIHSRLIDSTRKIFELFFDKEGLTEHEVKLKPFLSTIYEFDLQPVSRRFAEDVLQYDVCEQLMEIFSVTSGTARMCQDYKLQKTWEKSLLLHYPSMNLDSIHFIYHHQRGILYYLYHQGITVEALKRAVASFRHALSFCRKELDEGDFDRFNLSFVPIVDWQMRALIQKNTPPLKGFKQFLSLADCPPDPIWEEIGLRNLHRLIQRHQSTRGLSRRCLMIPDQIRDEVSGQLSLELELKGGIELLLSSLGRQLAEIVQTGRIPTSWEEKLFQLFHSIKESKGTLREVWDPLAQLTGVRIDGSIPEMETVLSHFLRRLTRRSGDGRASLALPIMDALNDAKERLFMVDPLGIRRLEELFSQLVFLSERSQGVQGRAVVLLETLKDDSGEMFDRPRIQELLSQFIGKVLRRSHHLAIPEDLDEKKAYYDRLETNLFYLIQAIQRCLRSQEKLDLIGPVIVNIAIGSLHCATRWSLEVLSGLEALSDIAHAQNFEAMITQHLYFARKKIMMQLLEGIFADEIARFGIEYLTHIINFVHHRFARQLGLKRQVEGLVSSEQAAFITAILEQSHFFNRFYSQISKEILQVAYHGNEQDTMLETLADFVVLEHQKGRRIDGLSLPHLDHRAITLRLWPICIEGFKSIQVLRSDCLSVRAQQEIELLRDLMRFYHMPEGVKVLNQKGILTVDQLFGVLGALHEQQQLESDGSELQGIFFEMLQSDRVLKQAFEAGIKKLKKEFVLQLIQQMLKNQFVFIMTTLERGWRGFRGISSGISREFVSLVGKWQKYEVMERSILLRMINPERTDIQDWIFHYTVQEAAEKLWLAAQKEGLHSTELLQVSHLFYGCVRLSSAEQKKSSIIESFSGFIDQEIKAQVKGLMKNKRSHLRAVVLHQKLISDGYLIGYN